jgi:hypothetical protein
LWVWHKKRGKQRDVVGGDKVGTEAPAELLLPEVEPLSPEA